jgi:NAD(P)-dependent dehydrogenase (short-subunit alcohol dehydrogenase family)
MSTPSIKSMKEAFDLSGKSAIVTGGNGGIGFGIAKCLAECGADVAIFCRDMGKAENALKELKPIGGKYGAFSCDIVSMPNVREAVAAACRSFGDFEILVNNAGVTTNKMLFDMDEDLSDWHRVVNTDLTGIVNMTYAVGRHMRDSGKGGSIVNITSNAGLMINRGMYLSPYSTAKAAACHFTRSMAIELKPFNIRVNAIAPGFVDDGFGKNMPQPRVDEITAVQGVDRLGTIMEIGAMAVYLASPAAGFTTGAVNVVDGGYMLSC